MKHAKLYLILLIFLVIAVVSDCGNATFSPKENSIVVYGDTRTGHEIHRKLVEIFKKIKPEAIFNTGDLVNDGNSTDDWSIFNSITFSLRSLYPYYPAAGNHEKESPLYYENFILPNNEKWYSVSLGNIYFIVLNSNLPLSPGTDQYNWLLSDISKIDSQKNFIVVIFHHPIFDVGLHSPDEKNLGDYLLPIFQEYGVVIVLSGHDHNYQRFNYNSIYFVVTGGGGAPLYGKYRTSNYLKIFYKRYNFCTLYSEGNKLIFNACDIDLNLIDHFELVLPSN